MIIKKVDGDFVKVSKQIAQDKNISAQAKGVLLHLLSLTEDEKIKLSEIEKHHRCGKTALRSALNELMQTGYVVRGERERGKDGRLGDYRYEVRQEHNESIVIHVEAMTFCGDMQTGLFFSICLNASDTQEDGGWFHKSQEEWERYGFTRHTVDKSQDRLSLAGILDIRRKGLPAKRYYRIDFGRLDFLIKEKLNLEQAITQNVGNSSVKNAIQQEGSDANY